MSLRPSSKSRPSKISSGDFNIFHQAHQFGEFLIPAENSWLTEDDIQYIIDYRPLTVNLQQYLFYRSMSLEELTQNFPELKSRSYLDWSIAFDYACHAPR